MWLEILIVAIAFMLGACIGSFTQVVVRRGNSNLDWKTGRSICETCKKQLSWYELIPVVSFIALRGKCKTCKTKIDPSHFIAELIGGLVVVMSVAMFLEYRIDTLEMATMMLVLLVLAMVSMEDLGHKAINVIPVYAASLIVALTQGWVATVAVTCLIVISYLVLKKDNFNYFGAADIDIIILVVAVTWSLYDTIGIIIVAALFGIVMWLLVYRKNKDSAIPMAPCFMFSIMLWYSGFSLSLLI